ncbi:MAG: hypothetical protein IPL65_10580 [Lewinellaceae bacterium]|nr:hypothetical protein [Lewinellaceae bacterium]
MLLKKILLPALVLSAGMLSAQQELFLNQSPALWSANSVNPAFFPKDKKFVIGLPSFGLDAAHSGDEGYNDLIRKSGSQTLIDFGGVIDKLEPENTVRYVHRFETLSFGLRLPAGFTVQAGHALRLNTEVQYPKSLPELLWNGNGPYIGQTLDIAPRATVFDFNDLHIGGAYERGRIRIGARMHYLSGISSVQSDPDHQSATVYTDNDIYQLSLQTDYAFHSASLVSGIDTSGLGFNLKTEASKGKLFSENAGRSFDFGVNIQLTKRIQLSASALDLGGQIKWRSNANYFRSNGSYSYEGVIFPGTDIINGADSIDFSTKLDTLNDIFQFVKTAEEFSTTLPARYYAGLLYDFSDNWRFGANVFHQTGDQSFTAIGLAAHWSPLRWLSLGGMYSINDRSAANIGFQLGLSQGPVQFYFLSDNLGSAFTPKGSPAVNFRTGLGLVF